MTDEPQQRQFKPMTESQDPEGRIRLFQNAWLEKLTVISIKGFAVTWVVFLFAMIANFWGTVSIPFALSCIFAGIICWSLFEYSIHRFLFHSKLSGAKFKELAFVLHGNHHAQPDDPLRNMMPPIVTVPVALAIWGGLYALFQEAGSGVALGIILGYISYDLVHYACHQWSMRGRLGTILKQHHMRHHHINADSNYAITGVFWDRLFGTKLNSLKR